MWPADLRHRKWSAADSHDRSAVLSHSSSQHISGDIPNISRPCRRNARWLTQWLIKLPDVSQLLNKISMVLSGVSQRYLNDPRTANGHISCKSAEGQINSGFVADQCSGESNPFQGVSKVRWGLWGETWWVSIDTYSIRQSITPLVQWNPLVLANAKYIYCTWNQISVKHCRLDQGQH